MAVSHEDITELKKVFDDRYVMRAECDRRQANMEKKFANDDKRIEVIMQKLNINNWLTLAVASGIVALVIKIFLGG